MYTDPIIDEIRKFRDQYAARFNYDVKAMLAEEGFDSMYGARPLKRLIQRRILDTLAMQMLEGRFHEGDHIRVTKQNGEMAFEKG